MQGEGQRIQALAVIQQDDRVIVDEGVSALVPNALVLAVLDAVQLPPSRSQTKGPRGGRTKPCKEGLGVAVGDLRIRQDRRGHRVRFKTTDVVAVRERRR